MRRASASSPPRQTICNDSGNPDPLKPLGTARPHRSRKLPQRVKMAGLCVLIDRLERNRRREGDRRQHRVDLRNGLGELELQLFAVGQYLKIFSCRDRRSRPNTGTHRLVEGHFVVVDDVSEQRIGLGRHDASRGAAIVAEAAGQGQIDDVRAHAGQGARASDHRRRALRHRRQRAPLPACARAVVPSRRGATSASGRHRAGSACAGRAHRRLASPAAATLHPRRCASWGPGCRALA